MVQMGVGEDNNIDGGRFERCGLPVPETQVLEALEEAAVDEEALPGGVEQKFRPGDGTGSSVEAECESHTW
jgi:hypothetical protein